MDDRYVEFMAWTHAMANECGFQFSVCVDGALFVFYMVLFIWYDRTSHTALLIQPFPHDALDCV
jgi:hypothetical protein